MKLFTVTILLFSFSIVAQNSNKYQTYFEKGNGNQSASYPETIAFYKILAQDFPTVKIEQMGLTDSGEPLHMVSFNPEKKFNFETISKNKAILMINNGIHAGEPDGIDASMILFRDLALGKIKSPKNTVLVTIPVYNIGGALNRNSTTRANQNGPEEYGFRGNARNYDLNRDLIKADTRNTKSFIGIFQKINPDVFIDNHVSNGSDYQYKLTYIMTQQTQLGSVLGSYFKNEMNLAIVNDLKQKNIETTPYVNTIGETPESGITQFTDTPRYTTGYTSLFNTIGYVVETHMLKNYSDRVKVTYEFMRSTIDYIDKNYIEIKEKRFNNQKQYAVGSKYTLKWEIDTTKYENIPFLGYESIRRKSEVTQGNRLFYDRTKPYNKTIKNYTQFKSVKEITIPKFYIIPKGYWNIIELMKINKIEFSVLQKDTLIDIENYTIKDFKTATAAYEGHYLHLNTSVGTKSEKRLFYKGDYLVQTQQAGIKYILETLEPEAVDSFFNWNYFDTILQQKEGYSDYVFEDTAAKILAENPKLKIEFDTKIGNEIEFSKNSQAQLDWVYKNSIYYEESHLNYPIYRVVK